jgi:hypothetical protein
MHTGYYLSKISDKRNAAMAIYLVERHLPEIQIDQFNAAQQSVLEASRQLNQRGRTVRYLQSIFIPAEFHSLCLFEALSAKDVQEVNEAAQFPFSRIIEAIELIPGQERSISHV